VYFDSVGEPDTRFAGEPFPLVGVFLDVSSSIGNAGGAGFRLTGDRAIEGERFKFWEND
jgi:hypothetical protein